MSNNTITNCSLVKLTAEEMQIRGGSVWREVFRLARYLKFVMDFFSEYKEDMQRGFEKGWKTL